jgi:DNA-binding transcriptional LysR family regulator
MHSMFYDPCSQGMELRHLRYFVTVADAAGISRAAQGLRMTQPALSRQIRDFERELGVRLFDRLRRRIVLTAEGEDLLKRCRDLLGSVESLAARAEALRGGTSGVLRVGGAPQTLEGVFAGFLTRYRRRHPDIEIQLTEDGGPALLDRVERGELHLAVTAPAGSGLAGSLLFPARIIVVAPTRHRLARRRTVDLAELAGERLLALKHDFVSRHWFDAACQVAHVRPQIVLESAAPHTLVALAAAGHGIAILPSTFRLFRAGVRLVPVVQDGKSLGGWAAIQWDPRRFLPVYAQDFIADITLYTSRVYPGRELGRAAPPVPRPPGWK